MLSTNLAIWGVPTCWWLRCTAPLGTPSGHHKARGRQRHLSHEVDDEPDGLRPESQLDLDLIGEMGRFDLRILYFYPYHPCISLYIYIYLWLCSASPFLLVPPCSTIFQPWILEENHFKGHPQAKEGERTPGLWADRMINHHKPWWMMNDKPLIFHL